MAGLLGDIYSTIDSTKRKLSDFVQNPVESTRQFIFNRNEDAGKQLGLLDQSFRGANGQLTIGPQTPQAQAAHNQLTDGLLSAMMIRTPFGRIPETGKEIDTMHKTLSSQLERAGNNVQSGVSNVSGSRYLTVKRDDLPDLQVRFSNHGDRYTGQMPGGDLGERFSVDPSSGNTFEMAKQFLKDGGVSFKPTPKTPAPKYTYEQLQGMTGGVNPQEVERIAKIMGWL